MATAMATSEENATAAHVGAKCDVDDVKSMLAQAPTVLDPEKDSGVEEADAYVLAVARKLRSEGVEARILTQETKDTPSKMSMSTAAGVLWIPCVPLKAFVAVESIPIPRAAAPRQRRGPRRSASPPRLAIS